MSLNKISENRISYLLEMKDKEVEKLQKINDDLTNTILNLEADIHQYKISTSQLDKFRIENKALQDSLERSDQEKKDLIKDDFTAKDNFNKEKNLLSKKFDIERESFRRAIEGMEIKLANQHQEEILKKTNQTQIEILEGEIQYGKNKHQEDLLKENTRNNLKFNDLKNKMLNCIKESQAASSKLSAEQMDVTSKLTLLQNHQMICELEYQSIQIEEILEEKRKLEFQIKKHKREIEIHKEVEHNLTEKNKNLCLNLKNLLNELEKYKKSSVVVKDDKLKFLNFNNFMPGECVESFELNNSPLRTEQNFNFSKSKCNLNNREPKSNLGGQLGGKDIDFGGTSKTFFNNSTTNKSLNKIYKDDSRLLNKVKSLESMLEHKKTDYENLKLNFQILEDKLKHIQNKYSELFLLFDEGLKKLSDEIQMNENNELYINLDTIKNGRFKDFPSEKKYTLLILFMKKLLPLIKPEDLQDSNYSKILDGNDFKIKNNIKLKRQIENPVIKKYFSIANFWKQRISIDDLPNIKTVEDDVNYPDNRYNKKKITILKY